MIILLPFVYLCIGWILGKTSWDLKSSASLLLTKIIIPVVITFNISTQFSDMGGIISATALIMIAIGKYTNQDPVMTLCFVYLNIGWLGSPVASALFGNDAAIIFIAAYVGSSIIGNSAGAGMLSGKKSSLIKNLKAPPVMAPIIGIFLIPLRQQIVLWFDYVYDFAKFLLNFLGMGILGLWLAKIKFSARDFRLEIFFYQESIRNFTNNYTIPFYCSFMASTTFNR